MTERSPKASTSKLTSRTGSSSSSLLLLQAELNRKKASSSTLPSTEQTYTKGPRPSSFTKKPSPYARSNKGIESRSKKDRSAVLQVEELDYVGLEGEGQKAKRRLEEKSRIYDAIKKGKETGLNRDHVQQLLVDFEGKEEDEDADDSSGSSDFEEEAEQDSDPIVEYIDELGRTRSVRRSQVPSGIPLSSNLTVPDPSQNVFYGDQSYYPVFTKTPEELEAIRLKFKAEQTPLVDHYDASKEVRTRGTAFFGFSKDEKERERQMRELKEIRTETELNRERREELGGIWDRRETKLENRRRELAKKKDEVELRRRDVS